MKSVVVLSILVLLTFSIFIFSFNSRKQNLTSSLAETTAPQLYWGAWAGGRQYGKSDAPYDMTTLDQFETNASKKVSIVRWGQPWKYQGSWQYFPTTPMTNVRNHGSIPLLDWGSWSLGSGESRTSQPDFQNIDVASGTYDGYIRQWADQAYEWGYPFFLRFNIELNGWWYSFQEGRLDDGSIVNGNRAGDYIKAWKHVWNIFNCIDDGIFHPSSTCKRTTNATWTWTINTITTATTANGLPRYPALSQVYPGDQYVDWVGVSLYNKNSSSYSFNSLFTGSGQSWLKNTYQLLSDVAPTKPQMLAEFGSYEYYNDPTVKASWLTDAIGTQILRNFPKLKAIVYYNSTNESGNSGSIIETSAEATNAFKNAISSPYYAANNFGSLLKYTKVLPLLTTAITNTVTPILKPGDVNRDGRVDILDFQLLSNSFGKLPGQTGYDGRCDFNSSNTVDILDFQILSNNFGS